MGIASSLFLLDKQYGNTPPVERPLWFFLFFLASGVWPLDLQNVILKITLRANCVF